MKKILRHYLPTAALIGLFFCNTAQAACKTDEQQLQFLSSATGTLIAPGSAQTTALVIPIQKDQISIGDHIIVNLSNSCTGACSVWRIADTGSVVLVGLSPTNSQSTTWDITASGLTSSLSWNNRSTTIVTGANLSLAWSQGQSLNLQEASGAGTSNWTATAYKLNGTGACPTNTSSATNTEIQLRQAESLETSSILAQMSIATGVFLSAFYLFSRLW